MRYSIAFAVVLLAIVALSAGSAYAGCGKKDATVGELESYDASTKALTISVTQTSQNSQKDKSVKLTLTPDSKTMGGRVLRALRTGPMGLSLWTNKRSGRRSRAASSASI